jgi:hypothetical protein
MRRIDGLAGALAVAAIGCGTSLPRPLPTLAQYTDGASAAVEAVGRLFEGSAPAPDFGSPKNHPLLEAVQSWRSACAKDCRAEASIADFSRRPKASAIVRLRMKLEGFAANGERVFADERFELDLRKEGGRWQLAAATPVAGTPSIRRAEPHLRETAAEMGLGSSRNETFDPVEARNYCIPATHHHPGVVLADFDGDGSIDIVLPGLHPQLFLNDGRSHFREATRGSGLDLLPPGEAAGGVAADLDGDGLPELFLTYAYSSCRLLHNDGGGNFHDMTREAGLAGLSGTFTSAVFFDADSDGRLDLFVAQYGDARTSGPAYSGKNGPGSRFFHNVERNGRPFFVDETESAGFTDRGWAFAASACDFDLDGDDDLYVANDFGTNCLYENVSAPGRPKFRQIAREARVLDEGYGMGVAWGDYDNDGRFDLHVADFSSPLRWIIQSPKFPMPPEVPGFVQKIARPIVVKMLLRRCLGDGLYRNLGNQTFEKMSEPAGVVEGGWAWGTEFVDLDGDGREDLLVVNGMWEAGPGGENDEVGFWNRMSDQGVAFHDGIWGSIDFGKNGMASRAEKHFYENLGSGKFEDRAWLEGFDTREDTRGLAIADLDGDGAPEIVLAVRGGALLVYRNGWRDSRRLAVRLRAKSPHNREAVGAIVKLSSGGLSQLREVRAGSSFLSCSAKDLYFGLGGAAKADSIEVRWPDGIVETRREVPAGFVEWREGDQRDTAK